MAGALDIDSVDIAGDVSRYDEWLSRGYGGAMEYLKRGRDRRANPREVFPQAQSILCVAMPYSAAPLGALLPEEGPRYARYLKRGDYHDEISEKLERVMAKVQAQYSKRIQWKVCVDTSAILERSWAAHAGLGWIGKNTMLIHPQLGSYLFLGEVLISEPTGHGPNPLPNYCGNCTRCLDACPTKALVSPGVLDSNECIAYWTLEKRGALPIDEKRKSLIGTWIAGCDLCQEACPFNTKAARSADEDLSSYPTSLKDWKDLLVETPEQYKARIQDSALSRVKPAQFSRNLAITLTNAAHSSPEDWLEEIAPLAKKRLETETDPDARAEWVRCVKVMETKKPKCDFL